MARICLLAAASFVAAILTGCGGADTGKNDQLNPVPLDQRQLKKDSDKKHSHEPG